MKLLLFSVSFLVALVASQPSVGSLPACAGGCITSAITASGCQLTDVYCFCTAQAFLYTIAPCIFANCSAADQATTESDAQAICNAASPPVTLPAFSTLLNQTNSSTSASGSSAPSTSTPLSTASASASAATSHSAAGHVQGDLRIVSALTAMAGLVFIAFLAV